MASFSRPKSRTIRRAGLAVLLLLALLIVLAQALLPGIATEEVETRLRPYGTLEHVAVHATPAIELLTEHADSVTIRAGTLRLTVPETAARLAESAKADRVDFTAKEVFEEQLRLHDVVFRKRGSSMTAEANLDAEDIPAALPAGTSMELLGSEAGKILVRVTGGLFGVGASVDAVAEAREGRIVARPTGLFSAFSLTIFSDPRVRVTSLAARVLHDQPLVYRLTVTATLP